MSSPGEPTPPAPAPELAIRLTSVDELFAPLDARPPAQRAISDEVRLSLLDQWDVVRDARRRPRGAPPPTLELQAPAGERAAVDEAACATALRADLRHHAGTMRASAPLSHRDRISTRAGVVIFLLSIAVSSLMLREATGVLVDGVSQGIVVVGWVALWAPATRWGVDAVTHHFARRRYAELAELDVRWRWRPAPAERARHHADR
ncbi:MAG: hypothetical protein JOZ07_05020 [Solirubrobacterales bacterium]|nr:hypothetical protein [Solirubrobacterales bacterium]